MKTPYEILGVTADADDNEIKQAYLQQVKNNPPDRAPERFRAIKQAYESIKDSKSRLNHALFTLPSTDFDALLDDAFKTTTNRHIDPAQFKKLLELGLDESNLLNAISADKPS